MDELIVENYKRYCYRVDLFKRFGYDIVKERDFIIEKAQPLEGKILEIGTGKGYFTIALALKGYHFSTVDISDEEQGLAKMNIQYLGLLDQVNFVIGDAQDLHFADASFHCCFGINLFHHLTQPLKVMDEIVRVTAPGGKIVISDFSREGFYIIEKVHESEGRKHDSGTCTLSEVVSYASGKLAKIERFYSKCQNLVIMQKRNN